MSQNKLIQTFFSPDKFIVDRKYNNTFIISTLDDGTHCFTFTLDHDKIIINSLDKCGITGNESLTLIDELSKIIPNINDVVKIHNIFLISFLPTATRKKKMKTTSSL